MLTYENFVAILLESVERLGLNVAYTQELLDTHALGRSLSITCLPKGMEDTYGPEEPLLRATVSFRWSPEFTVFSLRGGDSIDNIERMVDERLYAQPQSGPSLDVEVTYAVPLSNDQQHDVTALPSLARAIHELHAALVESDGTLTVDTHLSFNPGSGPRVQSVTALRTWSIDEALYDSDLLNDTFDLLCAELHDTLEMLAAHYTITHDERPPESGIDAVPSDRRYLKPPTA